MPAASRFGRARRVEQAGELASKTVSRPKFESNCGQNLDKSTPPANRTHFAPARVSEQR